MSRRQSQSMLMAGFVLTLLTAAAPPTNNVIATYTASTNTLNLLGDAANNTVTLTAQNGIVTVTGSNGTRINGLNLWSFNRNGFINLTGNLADGNDSLTILNSSVNIPTFQMGAGNDTFTMTNAKVAIITLDGGSGTDTFVVKGGSLSIQSLLSFP
ncbi:MAG: hypothetical protein WCH39_21360 [Schlesneria sp.]